MYIITNEVIFLKLIQPTIQDLNTNLIVCDIIASKFVWITHSYKPDSYRTVRDGVVTQGIEKREVIDVNPAFDTVLSYRIKIWDADEHEHIQYSVCLESIEVRGTKEDARGVLWEGVPLKSVT